ncbi:E3 ubiquitin-protein ligase PUB23-like [Cornus florida]|uniref:E3 ubiquitin-protein ligase PUB23-like n=1 Tax=Cornus florida TaxID=4283 RepID=UPI0028A1E805|nr:E3 ubiquitin-protein ligase PUB23-like [Cornus florida]
MAFPPDFRCPISMELMNDPVTISTGVTYERKNILKWFFTYKKTTCPATMQTLHNFDITPNHTLKRLILAWQNGHSLRSSPPPSIKHDELVSLLNTVESTPFKVSSLRKLKSIVEMCDDTKLDFKLCGGVQVLLRIVLQVLGENSDFASFRACEEALGVLQQLTLLSHEEDDQTTKLLSKPESMKAIAIMLQRGSAEARFYAILIFQMVAKSEYDWSYVIQDQGIDFFKSLLELVSDDICTKASSCALKVLIRIISSTKKSRVKAIEAGAICVLIELLPDSNRSKCEKILHLIKLLCECADGRQAFIEHGLGIIAVSKKMLHVSDVATKIGVKILWLICNLHPTERVLEDMLIFGSVEKLVVLLHIDGRSSTKDKVVKIFKLHGNSWRRYSCFRCDLKDYLGLISP